MSYILVKSGVGNSLFTSSVML